MFHRGCLDAYRSIRGKLLSSTNIEGLLRVPDSRFANRQRFTVLAAFPDLRGTSETTTIPQRPISSKFVRGERDVCVFVDKGLTVCGAFTVEIVSPKTVVDETRR
jgi:hypothetical protein